MLKNNFKKSADLFAIYKNISIFVVYYLTNTHKQYDKYKRFEILL